MSVALASVFACPGTGCSPRLPSRRCCGSTARHARFVWNLAVEQQSHWRPGRRARRATCEQCRQLTVARAEHPWLAAGSQTVQQQALRDFAQAMAAFFDPQNPAGRPSWRKAGRDEGFRIVGRGRQWDVRRVFPPRRPGLGAKGRVGAVPLVPRGAAGREVLPGDPGSCRPVACRLRRHPRADPAPGNGESSASTGAWRSPRPCRRARCCTPLA